MKVGIKDNKKQMLLSPRNFTVLGVAILVLSIMTLGGWFEVRDLEQRAVEQEFNDIANETSVRVAAGANSYTNALLGIRGFFNASEDVSRSDFSAYVNELSASVYFPGIQALEFANYVHPDSLDGFENDVQNDTSVSVNGYPDFTVRSSGELPAHYVVNYVEPMEGNDAAFGFDLFSNPERRSAIERAIEKNNIEITAPITLVQEKGSQMAFLGILPVYSKGEGETEGVIVAVFRADDLFRSLVELSGSSQNAPVYLLDVESNQIIATANTDRNNKIKGELVTNRTLWIGQREYSLQFVADAEFVDTIDNSKLSLLTLLSSLLASILITSLLYSALRTQGVAQAMASAMTKDLEQSRKELQEKNQVLKNAKNKDEAILSSISDGFVLLDNELRIISMNRAAQELLFTKEREVRGKRWIDVVSPRDTMGKIFDEDSLLIKQAMKKKKPIRTELISDSISYKRADESYFSVSVAASPVLIDNESIGGIIIFRDVSVDYSIDLAKSEFVSLASHQLRTPLSAINWYTEMLIDEDVGKISEKQKVYLQSVYDSSQRMVELVNSLLNVSRLETGTFAIDAGPVKVQEVVESVLKELQKPIEEKELKLKVKIPESLPTIIADEGLVRIILLNLITNAIKYTPEKGEMNVSVWLGTSELLVEVVDTGYGIPRDEQKKIFTKLYRASNIKKMSSDGTGLGLYIVKAILEKTGGRIWFESEENKGSTFHVTLPFESLSAKGGEKKLI